MTDPATDPATDPDITVLRSVLVVGTGLIGTSLALALTERGVRVHLADRDPATVRVAAGLGAGTPEPPPTPVDVAVLAVPPRAVPAALVAAQQEGLASSYTDVSSVKSAPLAGAAAAGAALDCFVGGHPMAGRERSGPAAARLDLFAGRPWVLTPTPQTGADTLARVTALVRLCRAVPVVLDPAAHDLAVALVSHAPHVLASLMAARLADAPGAALDLAGPGVADVTRVAEGDPDLWSDILGGNAAAVASVLDEVRRDLAAMVEALRAGPAADDGVVAALLRRGVAGRRRLPGKHGAAPTRYAVVPVLVPDVPGTLARLFADAGAAGINVEDVAIEHSPGAPAGVVELSVQPGAREALAAALRARGWSVHE